LPPPERIVGVIGKTNVGKSTFFSSLTMISVEISNRPFTTIKPNVGVAHVRKKCPELELGVKCSPRTGFCISGTRFIPVKVIDVAGLVPGSSSGRGLGNKFMDDLRQADVLIHVVDASGSTDPNGNPVQPGSYDPVEEAKLIQNEVDLWFNSVVLRVVEKVSRYVLTAKDPVELLAQNLSGLSVRRVHVVNAIKEAGLEDKKVSSWSKEDVELFSRILRRLSKPIIIAANKVDIPVARGNVEKLKEVFGEYVYPVSSLAEYILKEASKRNYIEYVPGGSSYRVLSSSIPEAFRKALKLIDENVIGIYGSTGVQQVLEAAIFNALSQIVVYPVEDHRKFTDHYGNVLPDAYIVSRGTTVRELAYMIHSELGETFLYAINARSGERLGESYVLRDGDVVKVVAAAAHS